MSQNDNTETGNIFQKNRFLGSVIIPKSLTGMTENQRKATIRGGIDKVLRQYAHCENALGSASSSLATCKQRQAELHGLIRDYVPNIFSNKDCSLTVKINFLKI